MQIRNAQVATTGLAEHRSVRAVTTNGQRCGASSRIPCIGLCHRTRKSARSCDTWRGRATCTTRSRCRPWSVWRSSNTLSACRRASSQARSSLARTWFRPLPNSCRERWKLRLARHDSVPSHEHDDAIRPPADGREWSVRARARHGTRSRDREGDPSDARPEPRGAYSALGSPNEVVATDLLSETSNLTTTSMLSPVVSRLKAET